MPDRAVPSDGNLSPATSLEPRSRPHLGVLPRPKSALGQVARLAPTGSLSVRPPPTTTLGMRKECRLAGMVRARQRTHCRTASAHVGRANSVRTLFPHGRQETGGVARDAPGPQHKQ